MALLGTAFLLPSATPVSPAQAEAWQGAARAPALAPQPEPTLGSAGFGAAGVFAALASLAGAGAAAGASRKQRSRAARVVRHFFGTPAPKPTPVPAGPLALPMLPPPAYRTLGDPFLAEMDAGFDPLNLATKDSPFGLATESYYNYREAEVKHGRLAMLATVGWLSSEELQAALARKLGLADELAPGELAPSLVNGGLGNLPAWFLPAVFAVSAWIELVPRQQGNRETAVKYKPQLGRVPGDLSFDPLDLQTKLAGSGVTLVRLHNAEVKHGRAAMIAITAFVLQEFITRVPVIREDEITADQVVASLDKGIEAVDAAAGLRIPDIPLPFPSP